MHDSRARNLTLRQYFLFFAVVASLLFSFADRNGYEGDDLDSISAVFQLKSALQGDISIYRYSWQPLAYWIAAGVFRLTDSPTAIFLLAPLAATITLVLLVVYMAKAAKNQHGMSFYVAILILMPELWFSGLYYNSSIIAMPLAVTAVLLLYKCSHPYRALVAGICAGLAILIRLDFILICPMLAVIAWQGGKSLKAPILLAITVSATLVVALTLNLITINEVATAYSRAHAEILARSQDGGWNRYTKTWVTLMALHPAGWLLLAGGGVLTGIAFWRKSVFLTLAYAIALIPLLYPIFDLLSVKYLLPLMVFLPVFLLHAVEQVETLLSVPHRRFVESGIVLMSIFALFVSVEPQSKSPLFIRVAVSDTRQVGTHDGTRSFGAYFIQMMNVYRTAPMNDRLLAARELLEYMQRPEGKNVLFVGDESFHGNGAVGWRYFQLLAEREGIHGLVAGKHFLDFKFGARHLWVSADLEADIVRITPHDLPLVIDARNATLTSNEVFALVHNALLSER
jgi:hypothetical protein